MKDVVTVIIPSFNPGAYLADAINSVLRQSFTQWRLLIIDDASTDDGLQRAGKYLGDARIRVIRNDVNLGQAQTLNRGLHLVETKYFLQLDADDWLEDCALEEFISAADRADDNVALVVSNVYEHTQETGLVREMRYEPWGASFANKYEILLANLFPWQKFYRTVAIKSLGGWPTANQERWRNVEDVAIFLRLIERYQFIWIDKFLYNYRLHERQITADRAKVGSQVEWLIHEALERWGGEYEPIFVTSSEGWRELGSLVPKTP